jgi:predicted TIM-barrel fold metal-dependent hydrolase
MNKELLLSSDSHVMEPPDLWKKRMNAKKYGDRIPQVVREGSNDFWYVDGIKLMSAARAGAQAGVRFTGNLNLREDAPFDDVFPGAYIPEARRKDNERDGIAGEVIYPTISMNIYKLVDPRLIADAFKAYNDWISEFCTACSPTSKGVGLVVVDDVDVAIAELERMKKIGLVSAMIPVTPRDDCPYSHPMYDSLWAAAQDLNIPLSLHLRTNRMPLETKMPADRHHFITQATGYTMYASYVQYALGNMIFSGVFERYPKLKVVSVEFDSGWVPYFLYSMDFLYTQRIHHPSFFPRFKSKDAVPSDFFRENVLISFQEDLPKFGNGSPLKSDNLMWGSDYPHQESTFPHSKSMVDNLLKEVAQEDRRKITSGNAARLYDIAVPA